MTLFGSRLRRPPAPVLQPKAESVSPDDVVRESERSRRVASVEVTSAVDLDESVIRPADLDMRGPLVAQIRTLLGQT